MVLGNHEGVPCDQALSFEGWREVKDGAVKGNAIHNVFDLQTRNSIHGRWHRPSHSKAMGKDQASDVEASGVKRGGG